MKRLKCLCASLLICVNYLVNFLVLHTRYRILLVYKDEETIFFNSKSL